MHVLLALKREGGSIVIEDGSDPEAMLPGVDKCARRRLVHVDGTSGFDAFTRFELTPTGWALVNGEPIPLGLWQRLATEVSRWNPFSAGWRRE